ncbi:hypothetical protein [Streptomyces sp. NPDC051776]|uniref:hypothetical protein n=1 Tax=Streptomyces sp. NPDC051776 TaxID=3155414 RepID=UPI00344875D7
MSTSNSPSLLEERFRAVLRVLPAYYRQDREEEMVDTFLSDHEPLDEDAELGRPRAREIAGVLVLAIRTRLAGPGAPARYVAYGRTARLVGLLGAALLAVSTAVSLLTDLAVLLAGSAQDQEAMTGILLGRQADSPANAVHTAFALLDVVLPLGWIAATVALGRGHRRRATVFCAVAALPSFMHLGRTVAEGYTPAVSDMAALALVVLVTGCVATAFHPGAARVEISRLAGEWIPAACALVMLATIVVGRMILGFDSSRYGWVFLVGGVAWLVLRVRARRRTAPPAGPLEHRLSGKSPAGRETPPHLGAADPAMPAALAALGLPVVAICLDTVTYLAIVPGLPTGGLIANIVQTVAVSLLEVTLLVVAAWQLRREPSLHHPSPTTPASAPGPRV